MSDSPRLRQDNPNALPAGTRLGEFELLRVLGIGGFGIVYLAFDHALEREVAIKEYMPASLAGRTETLHVSIRSQGDAESFALGLRSFVNEAKLLARFDHPSLLKVLRFWESNGTAYMAMPVMRGRNLKDIRLEIVGAPDEAWLRGILMPLLGAIERLHSEGVYHRDIAPDNIQIEPDGRPVLLDFGAARRVLTDKSQALTAILKPAYAPIEQYAEDPSVRQGPWTDLYSLGATLHHLLLGRAPPPATARIVNDEGLGLTPQNTGCTERFLRTLDWMLRPRPQDRPQSVAQLRDVLEGRAEPPAARAQAPAAPAADHPHGAANEVTMVLRPNLKPTVISPRSAEHVWLEPQPAAPAGIDIDIRADGADDLRAHTRPPEPEATRAAPARNRAAAPLLGLLGIAAAAVVAAVLWWPSPAPEAQAVAPAAAASGAPPAAAPAVAEAASAPVPAESASAPVPLAVAAPASAPAAVLPPPVAEPVNTPEVKPTQAVAAAALKPAPARPAAAEARLRTEPVPAPAAPAPEPSIAAGPPPACGTPGAIRYHVCMERECGTAEFVRHPACQRWKLDAKRE